jgi:hypothetical protein
LKGLILWRIVMKYQVSVASPRSKKIIAKLVLTLNNNSGESDYKEIVLKKFGSIDFEVPEHYRWVYSTSGLKGCSFDVQVEYHNSKGKKEIIRLVPERVGNDS